MYVTPVPPLIVNEPVEFVSVILPKLPPVTEPVAVPITIEPLLSITPLLVNAELTVTSLVFENVIPLLVVNIF